MPNHITHLGRGEYLKRATEWRKRNSDFTGFIKEWGYGGWFDNQGNFTEYEPTIRGGQIGFKSRKSREQGRRTTDSKRKADLSKQTLGDSDFKTDPVKNTQKHHLRMVSLYAPLYEGLSDSDARQLSQYLVDIGMPLGDKSANRGDLPPEVHDKLHNYMRKQRMTGKSMPSFKEATLDNRKKAANVFYKDFIQSDIDAKTMSLMQEYQSKNPKQYAQTYASQLDQVAQQTARRARTTAQPKPKNAARKALNQFAQSMRHGAPLLSGAMGIADEFGIPQVGTMQGGGFRVEANPLGHGESFMIP